ncbi:MAG: hypothetical protein NTY68_03330 [Candidatus Micrarchaeota archaeon]|nr:hypothetical protein [Candidatus Micrarchaeota archaeon]
MAAATNQPIDKKIEPAQQQNPAKPTAPIPPQKPIDPIEQAKILEKQLKYNESAAKMSQLLTKMTLYPIDISYSDFNKCRQDLLKLYHDGDIVVKGILIVELNERLSHIEGSKDFINAIKLAEKHNRQIEMKEIINKIYDSSYSMDGSIEMLKILAEIDDERSLRLLSNYLTKYLNQGSHLFRTLIIYSIRILGKSKNPFSIQIVLDLIETGSIPDYLYNDVNSALEEWNGKIAKMKIDPDQKKEIKERIAKILDPSKKGTKNYE